MQSRFVCILFCVLFACPARAARNALPQSVYVWQRAPSAALARAREAASHHFDGFHILAGEVSWKEERPVLARFHPTEAPAALVFRIASFRASNAAVRLGHAVARICDALGTVAPSQEVQIDFDAIGDQVAHMSVALTRLRSCAPRVTFTATPAWLDSPAFPALARAFPDYVLQVHWLRRQRGKWVLYDSRDARRAAQRASALGIPFRLALPTYAHVLAIDEAGRILFVESERLERRLPAGARLEVAGFDPAALSGDVEFWNRGRLPRLTGLLWFRLPLPDDRNAIPLADFVALASGHVRHAGLKTNVTSAGPGLCEGHVHNGGVLPAMSPQEVHLASDCAGGGGTGLSAFEAFSPYDMSVDDSVACVSAQRNLRSSDLARRGWLHGGAPPFSLDEVLRGRNMGKTDAFLSWRLAVAAGLLRFSAGHACAPDIPDMSLRMTREEAEMASPFVVTFEVGRAISHAARSWDLPAKPLATALTRRQEIEQAESQDLDAALRKSGWRNEDREQLRRAFLVARPTIGLAERGWFEQVLAFFRIGRNELRGLPKEFELYARGAALLRAGRDAEALRSWDELLALPAAERHFRTLWAMYMKANVLAASSPGEAVRLFSSIPGLARQDFADSLGLAAASFRRVAQLARAVSAEEHFVATVRAAVAGYATDPIDIVRGFDRVLKQGDFPGWTHAELVPVVNALVLGRSRAPALGEETIRRWHSSLGDSGDAAELLAFGAYEAGLVHLAEKWLSEVPARTGIGLFTASRLAARAGNDEESLALALQAVEVLAREVAAGRTPDHTLAVLSRRAAGQAMVAGRFGEALRMFVGGQHWLDATHVAERVLTADELKEMVETFWSGKLEVAPLQRHFFFAPAQAGEKLRYLLGRRLVREGRFEEAFAFLPQEVQDEWTQETSPVLSEARSFANALANGRDRRLSREVRSRALFDAAITSRKSGMEILGTEGAPDWRMFNGDYHLFSSPEDVRVAGTSLAWPALDAERARLMRHRLTTGERRFHYRFLAATLAGEAADLLPPSSLERCFILGRAGSWLKVRAGGDAAGFRSRAKADCARSAGGWARFVAGWEGLD